MQNGQLSNQQRKRGFSSAGDLMDLFEPPPGQATSSSSGEPAIGGPPPVAPETTKPTPAIYQDGAGRRYRLDEYGQRIVKSTRPPGVDSQTWEKANTFEKKKELILVYRARGEAEGAKPLIGPDGKAVPAVVCEKYQYDYIEKREINIQKHFDEYMDKSVNMPAMASTTIAGPAVDAKTGKINPYYDYFIVVTEHCLHLTMHSV